MAITALEAVAYARRTAHNPTGSPADTELLALVNDAVDYLAMVRRSNRWMKRAFLSLQTPYSTGTIALTNASTTVTLTTGTWPTWAASGRIFVNGQILDIATRSSSSVVLLDSAFGGDTDSSSSYVLFQDEYSLPDNMFAFGRVLPGQSWGWGGDPTSIEDLWEAQNATTFGQQTPSLFAIYGGLLVLHPYPSENKTIAYTYYARPTPVVTVASDSLDIDPAWLMPLHRSIDHQVALRFGKSVAGDAAATMASLQHALGLLADNARTPIGVTGLLDRYPHRVPPWKQRHG